MLTSRLRALLLPLALISGAACSHAQARPMVLVYHQVGAGSGASLGIAPQALRQRVETLRRLGYRFVTSSEAARAAPQEKVAVIQFDDGFESVYRLAFPVLRDLGVPGTAYVIWSRLDQPGSLSRAQVRELRAAGWEIGTHSHRHAALADLAPAGLRRELSVPDGEAARCVAYPLNRHDARVRRAASEQGLSCGVAGGPPALGRPDPLALPAPAITPWDDTLLPLRARWGLDARAPLLLAGVTEPALDTLLGKGAGEAPAVEPPLTWNPAHYELLGNGLISVAWRGERETRLAWREGRWSVNAAARRGVGRLDGVYTGGSVAFNVAPVTLAAGWDGSGPLLAGAVSLGGYGEVWGRASRLGGAWTWGAGATLIPADYVQISAAHGASGTQLGLRAALPWQDGEGRPLRLGGGYRWGEGAGPFAELEYRVGSYSLTAEVSGAGRFGVKFTSVW